MCFFLIGQDMYARSKCFQGLLERVVYKDGSGLMNAFIFA